MSEITAPALCGVQCPPPSNLGPNTRVVKCDLPRGHDGDHEETSTGTTWSGCTCDLVDVTRFGRNGEPEYRLGDPTGCPVHEPPSWVAARAEARHLARYGTPDA